MLLPSWQWYFVLFVLFLCSCRGRETHVCVVLSRLVVTFLISGWRSVTSSHTHIDTHTLASTWRGRMRSTLKQANISGWENMSRHTRTHNRKCFWRSTGSEGWDSHSVEKFGVFENPQLGDQIRKLYEARVRAKFRKNLVKIHFPDDCGSFISPCAPDLGYTFGRGRRFHSPSPDFPLSPARVCF